MYLIDWFQWDLFRTINSWSVFLGRLQISPSISWNLLTYSDVLKNDKLDQDYCDIAVESFGLSALFNFQRH